MNTLAIILVPIDDILQPYTNNIAVSCIEDIQSYSTNEGEYKGQLCKLLAPLWENGFYSNAEMCHFGVLEVRIHRFGINPDRIIIVWANVSKFNDCPTPEYVQNLKVCFRCTIIFQHLSKKHAMVITLNSNLPKQVDHSRIAKWHRWDQTQNPELVFWKSKSAYTDTPILTQFKPAELIILASDTCSFTSAGILNHYDSFWFLRPVYHFSGLCSMARQSYDMYIWNIFAITLTVTHQCKFLHGGRHIDFPQCSHKNIGYFERAKVVFWR